MIKKTSIQEYSKNVIDLISKAFPDKEGADLVGYEEVNCETIQIVRFGFYMNLSGLSQTD